MRTNVIIFSIFLTVFIGCEKDAEIQPRKYPFVNTTKISNNDSTGVTFSSKLFYDNLNAVSSYGFIWYSEDIANDTFKVFNNNTLTSSQFQMRVDSFLVSGANYEVRSFVCVGNKMIYGDIAEFRSNGCMNYPWSREIGNIENSFWSFNSFGISNNNNYGVIFLSYLLKCFQYYPKSKTFIECQDLPASLKNPKVYSSDGTNGRILSFADLGESQYIICDFSNKLFKLENKEWTTQSILPDSLTLFNEFYLGFESLQTLYFLNFNQFYTYSLSSDRWAKKELVAQVKGTKYMCGTYHEEAAYLLSTGKSVWKYDLKNDTWQIIATYPSSISSRMISFYFDNKIYFGLGDNSTQLWVLDLTTKEWKLQYSLPLKAPTFKFRFHFIISNKLYFGILMDKDKWVFEVWSFDPSKN